MFAVQLRVEFLSFRQTVLAVQSVCLLARPPRHHLIEHLLVEPEDFEHDERELLQTLVSMSPTGILEVDVGKSRQEGMLPPAPVVTEELGTQESDNVAETSGGAANSLEKLDATKQSKSCFMFRGDLIHT